MTEHRASPAPPIAREDATRADAARRAAARRCPRCGARLGDRAAAALAEQRRLEAAGLPAAVPDDAASCGCCGLPFASGS